MEAVVTLRPIDLAELPELLRLLWDSDASGEYESFGFRMDRVADLERRWHEDRLIGTDSSYLAVDVDGACGGWVTWRPFGNPLVVEIGIALLPQHRGHGIGTEAQRQLVADPVRQLPRGSSSGGNRGRQPRRATCTRTHRLPPRRRDARHAFSSRAVAGHRRLRPAATGHREHACEGTGRSGSEQARCVASSVWLTSSCSSGRRGVERARSASAWAAADSDGATPGVDHRAAMGFSRELRREQGRGAARGSTRRSWTGSIQIIGSPYSRPLVSRTHRCSRGSSAVVVRWSCDWMCQRTKPSGVCGVEMRGDT